MGQLWQSKLLFVCLFVFGEGGGGGGGGGGASVAHHATSKQTPLQQYASYLKSIYTKENLY